MRVKIVSDGTLGGSKVVNAETGETLDHVRRIELVLDCETGVQCILDVIRPDMEIECEAEIEEN